MISLSKEGLSVSRVNLFPKERTPGVSRTYSRSSRIVMHHELEHATSLRHITFPLQRSLMTDLLHHGRPE
jgi:hypothetical protein